MLRLLLTSILLLVLAAPVRSGTGEVRVYQCVSDDGHVSYQDQACPPSDDSQLRLLPLPDAPPNPQVMEEPPESSDPPSPSPPREPAQPVAPPPQLWICVDEEGRERESSDGIPKGRYVPLWVIGRDPYAPAQTFGRVGQTRALPRVQSANGPAISRAPAVSGPLTYVEERCRPLPAGRVCERYTTRLRELQRSLFNSQASDRAEIQPEADRLKRHLEQHCRRR